jgi:hypothetical protein
MNSSGTFISVAAVIAFGTAGCMTVFWIKARSKVAQLNEARGDLSNDLARVRNALENAQQQLAAAHATFTSHRSTSAREIADARARISKVETAYASLKGKAEVRLRHQLAEIRQLQEMNGKLSKWSAIVDAEAKAQEIIDASHRDAAILIHDARLKLAAAEAQIARVLQEGRQRADEVEASVAKRIAEIDQQIKERRELSANELQEQSTVARMLVESAKSRSQAILSEAETEARKIAGDAWDAKANLEKLQRLARAIENQINGYGDRYLVPTYSLLDDLSEEMGHTDPGQRLKDARIATRALVDQTLAATCDYAETSRRETAMRFILDAFNGKVDAILARVKADNAGTLAQQIRDSFEIVNRHGEAFRDARITPAYLDARLDELKWAALANHLKAQERDEQRRVKEQAREEERVRRETDRAQREAAKQVEIETRAVEKLRAEMEQRQVKERADIEARIQERLSKVDAEQRAQFETKLRVEAEERLATQKNEYEVRIHERDVRLQEALERGQRAKSMAEQTKRGHVYVISNVGSLGEGVYKIGLTRRLDPMDRIWELGDASVPFDFDVHAMMLSDDAPALETKLHRHFILAQVNKVNRRKEFFRMTLADIRGEIESLGLNVQWTMAAAAAEYRETVAIEKSISTNDAAREAWIAEQLRGDSSDIARVGVWGADTDDESDNRN